MITLAELNSLLSTTTHPGAESINFRADFCSLGVFRSVTLPHYLRPLSDIWRAVKPRRYLAVGVLLGTMEAYALKWTAHSPETIVVCDTDEVYYNPRQNNLAAVYENITRYFHGEFVIVRGDSSTPALRQLGPFDLAYVDAEHTREAVKQDLENVWPLLAPKGVVLVHDIDLAGSGVREGYVDFISETDCDHIELSESVVAFGLGVLQKAI